MTKIPEADDPRVFWAAIRPTAVGAGVGVAVALLILLTPLKRLLDAWRIDSMHVGMVIVAVIISFMHSRSSGSTFLTAARGATIVALILAAVFVAGHRSIWLALAVLAISWVLIGLFRRKRADSGVVKPTS